MAAVALHFVWYNFVRVHQTLRVTPRWKRVFPITYRSIEELAGLLDQADKKRRS